MLNPFPCIAWPLVGISAFAAYRMWKSRRDLPNAWIMPGVFFVGVLFILWSVAVFLFKRFWMDGLFAIYFPQ